MEPILFSFKHYPDERYIAKQPWYVALKSAKTGLVTRTDYLQSHDCRIASKYKLKSIDPCGRTPAEVEMWNKVIQTAETQARVRAAQMHLNVVTTLSALPLTVRCCDNYQSQSAAVARQGLHTDEIDRDWIYDTGAATCLIGTELLTNEENAAFSQCHHKTSLRLQGSLRVTRRSCVTFPTLVKDNATS